MALLELMIHMTLFSPDLLPLEVCCAGGTVLEYSDIHGEFGTKSALYTTSLLTVNDQSQI